ncbi:hypothetical protein MTO96_031441 [Rhipicephalus appendiculatus]
MSLLRSVCKNRWIKTLDVSGLKTSVSCILPLLTQIEKLSITPTEFSSGAYVAQLCVLLQSSSSLKRLYLSARLTNEEIIGTLFASLKIKPTLVELEISLECDGYLQDLKEYLSSTTVLKVFSMRTSKRCVKRAALEGILENRSIEDLRLHAFIGDENDEEITALASRVIKQNRFIRKLYISTEKLFPPEQPSLYDCWILPLVENDILQEVTLPSYILHPTTWSAFFRALPVKQNLEMVRIEDTHNYAELQWLCGELKQSGAEEKVSLGTLYLGNNVNLLQCKAFSRVDLYGVRSHHVNLVALSQLPNCRHLKYIHLRIQNDHTRLSSALAEYLRSTTALKTLHLEVEGVLQAQEDETPWWNTILESLSRNTSLRLLIVGMLGMSVQDAKNLADSVKRNASISGLIFSNMPNAHATVFFRRLSEFIEENYTLTMVGRSCGLEADAVSYWLAVQETTWRNFGLVARAARIKQASHFDRYVTGAVERVARYPAMMDEVARTAKLEQAELAVLVRDRLLPTKSMDGFMRYVGVVKERVICHPTDDGRMHLDDLNEDCWSHVRRYLMTDDVKWDAVKSSECDHERSSFHESTYGPRCTIQ